MWFSTHVLLTPYNSSLCFCAILNDMVRIFLVLLVLLICLLKRHFSLSLPLNMDNTLFGSSRTSHSLFSFLKRTNNRAHHYSKRMTTFILYLTFGYLDKLCIAGRMLRIRVVRPTQCMNLDLRVHCCVLRWIWNSLLNLIGK